MNTKLTTPLTHFLTAGACALLLGAPAEAQNFLAQGDIAAAASGFVGLLDGDGVTSEEFASASFVTRILWDPNAPDEFICGGTASSFSTGGFLVRQVFSSSTQMTTTTLAPAGSFSTPLQLSWDATQENVIVVTNFGQVHSVNATTGAVIDLTTGVQPWSNVTCGVFDPVSQDVFVGTSGGEIWRLASGGGPATLFQTVDGSLQRMLAVDLDAPRYLHYVTTDSFGREALDLAGTSGTYFGALGQPQLNNLSMAAFDEHGDFVLGSTTSEGTVYSLPRVDDIPLGGIAPTSLGNYTYSGSSGNFTRDISVVGATLKPFRLTMEQVGILGANVEIENVPGPLGRGWFLLSAATLLPIDSGPLWGIVPDALTILVLNAPPTPGGLLSFSAPAPAGFTLPQFTMAPFAGQTWDGVVVAFATNLTYLGRSNVERVTW